MMVPMWPKHVAYEYTFLLRRRFFWLIMLYICNTQQDAHYEDSNMAAKLRRIYWRRFLAVCCDSRSTSR
jgi:hypothetical protein